MHARTSNAHDNRAGVRHVVQRDLSGIFRLRNGRETFLLWTVSFDPFHRHGFNLLRTGPRLGIVPRAAGGEEARVKSWNNETWTFWISYLNSIPYETLRSINAQIHRKKCYKFPASCSSSPYSGKKENECHNQRNIISLLKEFNSFSPSTKHLYNNIPLYRNVFSIAAFFFWSWLYILKYSSTMDTVIKFPQTKSNILKITSDCDAMTIYGRDQWIIMTYPLSQC